MTGQCQCAPGWIGNNCNLPCPDGSYGVGCTQQCKCKNGARCRKNDGYCICTEGRMGVHCDEVCPEGFYGKQCLESCSCPSPFFVCHAAKGCVCRVGFTGPGCNTPINEALELARDRSAGVTWGAIVALILVGVIIFVLLYFRRRVQNLKTEIAHVTYIADPTAQDRHHFDNPVYAFQSNSHQSIPDSATLLNNLRAASKPTNVDRYRFGSDADSMASSRGKFSELSIYDK